MITLNQIKIASPCGESWASMTGDEHHRFCKICSKTVYNLSGMTEEEGLALIAQNDGHLCVRFRRRQDGTLLTADCPVGRARVRKRRTVSFAWAAAMVVSELYVISHGAKAVQLVQRAASSFHDPVTPKSKLQIISESTMMGSN